MVGLLTSGVTTPGVIGMEPAGRIKRKGKSRKNRMGLAFT
jgi:hypothetical protein